MDLPYMLYAALVVMAIAAIYNLLSWTTFKYYCLSNYPELSPKVRDIIRINRLAMFMSMILAGGSIVVAIGHYVIKEDIGLLAVIGNMTIAIPTFMMSLLLYRIFTDLHEEQ